MESPAKKPLMSNGMTISNISLLLFLTIGFYAMDNPLNKYKWSNRIILIYGDDSKVKSKQMRSIQADNQGYKERDLVIFLPQHKEKLK